MVNQLYDRLRPVRQRQQRLWTLQTATWGLFGGALAVVAAGIARLCGAEVSIGMAAGLAGGGLCAGVLAGVARRLSWMRAAQAVDACYGLKDRTATALEFAARPDESQVRQLQFADAVNHLDKVDPKSVSPFGLPRLLPGSLAALLIGFGIFLIPVGSDEATASPTAPLAHVLQEAQRLEETMIEELEQANKDAQDENLEELVEELRELLQEMKEPGVDEREALAKMSEMQAAIAALQAEYNVAQMDAQLEAVGEALAAAAALEPAAEAMKNQNYKSAADELEKVYPEQISQKEAKALEKSLAKLVQNLEDGQANGELSKSLSELSAGLSERNSGQCRGGSKKLAGLCRKQSLRKSIGQCLGCQLGLLSECKGNCRKNGGDKVAKSNNPSNSWGTGKSGEPLGDEATQLGGARNREEITGTAGDGPSEKEVSHSPEGRQEAARSYREVYQEYQKMSEAVLESEPLPLGHRQTIRRYFEAIRPQNAELDDVVLPEAPEN